MCGGFGVRGGAAGRGQRRPAFVPSVAALHYRDKVSCGEGLSGPVPADRTMPAALRRTMRLQGAAAASARCGAVRRLALAVAGAVLAWRPRSARAGARAAGAAEGADRRDADGRTTTSTRLSARLRAAGRLGRADRFRPHGDIRANSRPAAPTYGRGTASRCSSAASPASGRSPSRSNRSAKSSCPRRGHPSLQTSAACGTSSR